MSQKITFWVKKCYFLAINVIFGQKKAPAARAGTTKKAFKKEKCIFGQKKAPAARAGHNKKSL